MILKWYRCRAGLAAVADRFLRITWRWLRVRHLAGSRRITADTAVPVGSPADHRMCCTQLLIAFAHRGVTLV